MRHGTLIAILITGLLVWMGIPPGAPVPARAADDVPAKPSVPEIRTRDLDGKDVSLHELLATGPVLLDFWALWCRPCLKELPNLDRLREKYADRGLTVIAVNGDTPVEVNKVKPFIRSRKYGFRVITDVDGELRRKFQINAFPTLLLLAPDGTTVWAGQGYRPGDEKNLEKKLSELLSDKDSGEPSQK